MARKRKDYRSGTPTVWWDTPIGETVGPEGPHRLLFPHVRALEQDQEDVHWMNMLNTRLYTNLDVLNFSWNEESVANFRPLNANLENVIQSVLDTLVSRVGKMRPKATIVPRGADFDVYLRGRQLDRYLWGEFQAQSIHAKGEGCFLDGMIYGTGVLRVDIDSYEKCIFTEQVNPDEIIVDQRECVSTRMPRQLSHRRLLSRLWLKETYGDLGEEFLMAIREAQSKNFHYTSYRDPVEDQIVVIETWKLPTRSGCGDGRHTICIENATLVDEEYTRDRFPFVFYRWNEPKSGFYGRSLVADLTGYQIRLNELNEDIRMGQQLMCVPRILVDQSSAIMGTKIDNTIGKVVSYRGTLPEALTWNAFNPEIYNERDRVREAAFRFAGVSEMAASNALPSQARLDSSEALREYSDISDERFNHQAQFLEQFYLEVARHLIDLSAELYTSHGVDRDNYYKSCYLVQQIRWSEVDMERDKYDLQISASSILNMSPAARKDKLNEWAAAGVITQNQYKAFSGEPDLERMANLMAASNDYIESTIDKLLAGLPQTPDPFANLQEGLRTVVDTYLHLRSMESSDGEYKVPEEILQGFRDWIELSQSLLGATATTEMALPVGAMPPVDPMMGMPMAPAPMEPGIPVPPQLPGDALTSPQTGAPVPSISMPVANAFVS